MAWPHDAKALCRSEKNMDRGPGEDWWYLLHELIVVHGIGYAFLFVLLAVWSRLLLLLIADDVAKHGERPQP